MKKPGRDMNAVLETEVLSSGISIQVARARRAVVVAVETDPDSGKFRTVENQADEWMERWGRWARNISTLGYPTRSVSERANEGGIAAGSPRPPTTMPDDVAITDKAVGQIKLRHRSIEWRTLELIYLRGAPMEGVMHEFRISRSAAYRLKARALRAVYRARQAIE